MEETLGGAIQWGIPSFRDSWSFWKMQNICWIQLCKQRDKYRHQTIDSPRRVPLNTWSQFKWNRCARRHQIQFLHRKGRGINTPTVLISLLHWFNPSLATYSACTRTSSLQPRRNSTTPRPLDSPVMPLDQLPQASTCQNNPNFVWKRVLLRCPGSRHVSVRQTCWGSPVLCVCCGVHGWMCTDSLTPKFLRMLVCWVNSTSEH